MGYSGTYVSGQAYTDNGRWDDSLKYKVSYGPARFAAMYKFRDGNGGSNNAGGILPTRMTPARSAVA